MRYKFYREVIEDIITLGVMPEEEKWNILFRFGDSGWTSEKVQSIIENVENNRILDKASDPYVWGNEDVALFVNEIGVLLVDKVAMRVGQETKPLELAHDEFITFLVDFKKFIEENS